MKAIKWIGIALGAIWATFVFIASNSPTDVSQRTSGWLAVPLVRSIPDWFVSFASNVLVLAITFTLIGGVIGWYLRDRKSNKGYPWYETLGTEMSLLAFQIEDAHSSTNLHRLNAEIRVIFTKASSRGLAVPSGGVNKSIDALIPYLSQVSSFLKAGQIQNARVAALQLSQDDSSAALQH